MSRFKLDSGWLAARASEIQWSGEQLTTSQLPSLKINPWMEAVVPGTVLTTLLKNKMIPDPFYGMENNNVPDIADAGREHYTFWFFNAFPTPEKSYRRAWLHLRAINYSAEVYVNGSKFSLPGGMFFRHKLDITDALKKTGQNNIAVIVHPPDHPGRIPPEGGQGGDHDIAKDVAAQYVQGWDWIIPIRDRNTGLWDEVAVSFTGVATLSDPHLVASFYDDFRRAYLHASSEIKNLTSATIKCTAKLQVTSDSEDSFCLVEGVQSQQLEIPGGQTVLCTFTPQFFYKPQLWWPNGMGKQPLYQVDITLDVDDQESDTWSHHFGFRKITSFIDPVTNSRQFQVNGQPVFIRGGNWIVSDGLLRLSKERYETDVNFHADMNMNMIRVWGGALAERPEFYEACDKRGLLVWQEFWITGDCNGRGVEPSDPNWPLDHALFLKCARDTVKLLRNHPSLALWVGGNEQHPPEDINQTLTEELKLFNPETGKNDPSHLLDGTRLYIQGSLWEGFAKGNGDFRDGPYNIVNLEDYYQDDFYLYGFNPEVGSVGVPLAITMKATLPEQAWSIPSIEKVSEKLVKEVPNKTWELHTYIPYSNPEKNVPHQIAMYGDPKDLDDFCEKAQLVNYAQYRALMESWNSRMWTKYSGVLIWKTQNPWPGLRGQLYDHFLDQTGGFYGVKSACEPVHVQLNLVTFALEVANTTRTSYVDARVEVSVFDSKGKSPYQNVVKNLNVPAYKTINVTKLEPSDSWQKAYFLLLKLVDGSGALLSRNFYWLHQPGEDYKALTENLAPASVKMSLKSTSRNGSFGIELEVENMSTKAGSEAVAFWLRFSVHSRSRGYFSRQTNNIIDDRVLPVTYSQNYFSLVPGEKTRATISFNMVKNEVPELVLQGWNIKGYSINLPHSARYEKVVHQL